MQTIATKIAAVKTVFAAAFPDADDKFISHAIHGVGDSPRRACRLGSVRRCRSSPWRTPRPSRPACSRHAVPARRRT